MPGVGEQDLRVLRPRRSLSEEVGGVEGEVRSRDRAGPREKGERRKEGGKGRERQNKIVSRKNGNGRQRHKSVERTHVH